MILLITAVAAAVTVVAVPEQVVAKIRAGVCMVGGGEDCGDGGPGGPGASPSPSPSPSMSTSPSRSPSPSASASESPEERELREAREALAAAEQEAQDVEGEWDEFDLLAEIGKIGLDFLAGDIIACVEEPNLVDCLWALVGLVPWGKIGKLLKSIPKVIKLIDRFLDLKRRLDKARKARKDAKDRLDDALEACEKKRNSFVPGTRVLMADGSRRPIEDVQVGDSVWATDPRTGRDGPQPVTALITGTGLTRLVDLTIDLDGQVGGPTTVVTATAEHPFWVSGTGDWIRSGALVFGDRLATPGGREAMVVATHERVRRQRVHNLTVAGPHTYHVVAADRGVLVHNDPVDPPGESCDADGPEPSASPSASPTAPGKGQPDPASQAGDVDLIADKLALHANHRSIPGVPDEELAEYLEGIMRGTPGIKMRPSPSGTPRWAWWDSNTGTMVIREGNDGTFMQPDRGYQYFLDQINE
ncbi:polymorphic toxin-type HINT domain-containing protein [Actinomadura sp. 9N407]|uniref:polymorphic toxin-type HINT domain-containing protein n=1 Tax=Actinomadura sp. 9N407 TaxID=3375154 RepID=UPI0037BEAD72